MKQLLTRINETNALVIQLDKRIAVLVNDTTRYRQRFDTIERRIDALEKSVWKKQD
jgi:hypothetical protein